MSTSAKSSALDKFRFGKVLGSGTFATVVRVTDSTNNVKYAMKIIDKARCKGHEKHIVKEIAIMKKVQHRNIIQLIDVFETSEKIFMQLELVTGGELFDRIISKGHYSEADAKRTIVCILDSINYLHGMNVVHRDLKPENLLLSDTSDTADVKLADFGLSTVMAKNTMLETSCGTLSYAAPEVLKGEKYGLGVDMWSIGVISYILLCGYPPFHGKDDSEILESTIRAEVKFRPPEWDLISSEAKKFISTLIVVDTAKRATAKQAINDPWVAKELAERQNSNLLGTKQNLRRNFNSKEKKDGVDAILYLSNLQMNEGITIDLSNGTNPPSTPRIAHRPLGVSNAHGVFDLDSKDSRIASISAERLPSDKNTIQG